MVPFQPEPRPTEAQFISGRHQLDIDINTIVFDHHHLFSAEHVCAAHLSKLYEEYVSRTKKRTIEHYTAKVGTRFFFLNQLIAWTYPSLHCRQLETMLFRFNSMTVFWNVSPFQLQALKVAVQHVESNIDDIRVSYSIVVDTVS